MAGQRPPGENGHTGGEGLNSGLPGGVVDQEAGGAHQPRHVVRPAEGDGAGDAGGPAAQPLVPAAEQDGPAAVRGEEPGGAHGPGADAPRTGGEEDRRRSRFGGVRVRAGHPVELRGDDGSGDGGRAAGGGAGGLRALCGEADVEVVAGVQPAAVDGEVGDEDRGGDGQDAFGAEPAGDLRGQVEGGDEQVRAEGADPAQQAGTGRRGQGRAAGAVPVARGEEEGVDGGVQRGGVPHRPPVEGAQGRTRAGRQEGEDVAEFGGGAPGAEPAGQFAADRVVPGAHARAEQQDPQASHAPPLARPVDSSTACMPRPGGGAIGPFG